MVGRAAAGAAILLLFGFISGYLLFFALGAALLLSLGLVASRGSAGPHRECPFCKEKMRREATVCPHCRSNSGAA